MVRKLFMAVPIVALAIGGSTACASKKFVRTSVGEVNDKVEIAEKRDALIKWGTLLRSIVNSSPTTSNVITLRA